MRFEVPMAMNVKLTVFLDGGTYCPSCEDKRQHVLLKHWYISTSYLRLSQDNSLGIVMGYDLSSTMFRLALGPAARM
jgi:hypothetical protein